MWMPAGARRLPEPYQYDTVERRRAPNPRDISGDKPGPRFHNASECRIRSMDWRDGRVRAAAVALSILPAISAQTVEFNRDIRPILSNRCFACHGPDAGRRQ